MSKAVYYSNNHIFTTRSNETDITLKASKGKTLIVEGAFNLGYFRITGNSAQTIVATTFQKLTTYWNGTATNINNVVSFSNGNATIRTAGTYCVNYNVNFPLTQGAAGSYLSIDNSSLRYGSNTSLRIDGLLPTCLNSTYTSYFAAGTVLSVYVNQTSGVSTEMAPSIQGSFTITRIC